MSIALPSIFQTNASSAGPGGAGKADGWIKVQAPSAHPEYSLFLNQPKNPSQSSKSASSKPEGKVIYVQDSGVALPSFVSNTTPEPHGLGSASLNPKVTPPPGNETIDDDWEVVYPDT